VIILSVTLVLLLGYIIWSHFAARRATSLNSSHRQNHDVEKGAKVHHNTPETPDTVVGANLNRSSHPHIHMSRDGSSQDCHSYYKEAPFQYYVSSLVESITTPATPAGSPASPSSDTSTRSSEMSVGDRLRSQQMIRETTGDFTAPAKFEFLLTLPVEESQRCHSRSSLYTIAEAEAEASSQESTAPVTPITASSQAEISSAVL
jgi:hypothetical protein